MREDGPWPGDRDEGAPEGGVWVRLYAVVLGVLAVLIGLFYLFGRSFR